MPSISRDLKKYYDVLELKDDDSSEDTVRIAYKKLALKWHPDRHQDDKEEAQRKFVEVQDAYTSLLKEFEHHHHRRKRDQKSSRPGFTPSKSSSTSSKTETVHSETSHKPSSGHQHREVHHSSRRRSDDKPSHTKTSKSGSHSSRHPFARPNSEYTSDEDNNDNTIPRKPNPLRDKHKTCLEEDSYEFVDLGTPLQPLLSPKSAGNHSSKDWIFPLRLSLDDLYHGASLHYRITRTLCSGKTQSVKIDIKVSPGWRKGTRIRVPNVGNEMKDGSFQDIVFVVEQEPHSRFTRVGDDLLVTVQVPWAETHTATPYPSDKREESSDKVSDAKEDELAFVKGLDGEEFGISIPRSLVEGADGTRIVGAGMPIRQHGEVVGKGDLMIKWEFIFLDTSEKSQRSRWNTLKKAMNWRS
ncbi:hypothetical protein ABKN59_010950 [Abortiporus biennis]